MTLLGGIGLFINTHLKTDVKIIPQKAQVLCGFDPKIQVSISLTEGIVSLPVSENSKFSDCMLRIFSQIPTMHHLGKRLSTTQGYGRDEDGERDISKMSALNTPESPSRKPFKKGTEVPFPY